MENGRDGLILLFVETERPFYKQKQKFEQGFLEEEEEKNATVDGGWFPSLIVASLCV